MTLDRSPAQGVPYAACALVGLGGLFAGVTGPLVSTFLPPLVQNVLGDDRTAIGLVMALDNVLLLLLVPLAGAASDRLRSRGRGRRPIMLPGLVLAAAGMALLPESTRAGLAGLLGGMILLFTGINLQRSPFQALIADLVPSRYRSLASWLGHVPDVRRRNPVPDAGTDAGDAGRLPDCRRHRAGDRRRRGRLDSGASTTRSRSPETTFRSMADAARSALRGDVAGLRAIFVASLLLQLTFQTFTTWYALHATERFGVRPEDVTVGFIAWAVGGVIGALPAGIIGGRIGRRKTMLLGFALMAATLVLLNLVTSPAQATPLIALASAAWTLPTVNAYPLFIEPVPRRRRGILAALFLLCIALGGAIGDPLNGSLFDLFGSYRPLFLVMAVYTALAFAAVLMVSRGTGEADTVHGEDGVIVA